MKNLTLIEKIFVIIFAITLLAAGFTFNMEWLIPTIILSVISFSSITIYIFLNRRKSRKTK